MATLEEGEVVVAHVTDVTISSDKMGTLEDNKLAVAPDVKSSQHIKNLSNFEAQPNKGLSASETQATGGDANELDNAEESLKHELGNSEPESNHQLGNVETPNNSQPVASEATLDKPVVSSEAQPNNQVVNSEALSNNGVANSEILTSHNGAISETQGSNEVVVSETQCSNQVVNSKALPNNGVVNSESQGSNNVAISETQGSNEVFISETRHRDEVVVLETQYSNGVIVSETQHSNEVAVSETHHSNEIIECETQHAEEVVVSETQQNNEVIVCETQHDNEMVVSETQQNNEVIVCETQHGNEVIMSDSQPSSEVVMSETQPCGDVVMSDTQLGCEVVMSDIQPVTYEARIRSDMVGSSTLHSNEVAMSDAQTIDETVMHEAQFRNDVVVSEALSEFELADSTIDPNIQLSYSETLHDNHQFSDLDLIPEDQLPQPEPLPNSESPPRSEPLADSNHADMKPVPHNHLPEYEMLPNNHLDHSEALANYQLANNETLSHDQLASSQMMTHYELVNSEPLHSNQLITSQGHYEIVSAQTIPSYEIVNAETLLNNEEHTPDTQPNKRRKKKSIVWQHFTIETVGDGCRRAYCNECKQSFAYSTGSKVAGTSHLKRHIAKGACPTLLRNQDPNQETPYTPHQKGDVVLRGGGASVTSTPKRRYRSPSTPYIIFDQDRCRHEIAKMVIMHDYPLHMVEHPGFVAFVKNLQPQFNMVSFNTVQGDCVAAYLNGRSFLVKYFRGLPGRVCLTLDVWSSSQSVGYVLITGHFSDSDWKLHRRVLNVVMEPYPDSDTAISHAVAACIMDWNLQGRMFSITCNQALTEVSLENLRPLLSVKNPLILNGQLLIGNCIARTLSNVANDLLSLAQDIVSKIRDSVKYVKTSYIHEDKFLELKQQLQVPSERSLFIDDLTKWNTTYEMLVAASELKEVFSCLDTYDPDYKGAPSIQDWKLVETLCTYLKPLFDAANILLTTTHPAIITCFHEVWKMQLDLARAAMNEDPFISNLTKPMQERIGKYWRDCSLILATAVVMDPRFKMKLVEFSFTKIYGKDAHVHVKIVNDGIHELFHEYVNYPLPLTAAYAEGDAGSLIGESQGGTLTTDNGLTDFDAYIMETSSQQMKSELDQYLEESLLPRVPDFDVLGWWKINKVKYPTLSKMARDILSIPVSTVPSESFFDRKSKEMDQYRSSLRPEAVEALVCTKDWMQYIAAEMGM
ncbi:zinc finger BED domain-containing protein DAYSLEEPER-like [Lotus japonicus]|uniref:zinc finger BED domain-containing protein DAYSLEEPER-like n=1 Tax=Lotus japonicus TaxID=34305 RepID=UPI00258BABE1|nr:zinc finger BED domain-containing protein DAYSLEEPER-like [Lotus japonicus]